MATYSDFVRDDYKRPIPGATAKLFSADGTVQIAMATTGADGQFTLDAVDGKYLLEVSFGGASDRSSVLVGNPPEYIGPTGPANSTYPTLDAMKAADAANLSFILTTASGPITYAYVTGNFTGKADDVNVVGLTGTPLATGALVRQGGQSVSYTAPEAGTKARDVSNKFDEGMVSVWEFMTPAQRTAARAKFTPVDCTAAFNAAFTVAASIGRDVYVPNGAYLVGNLLFGTQNPEGQSNAPAGLIGESKQGVSIKALPGLTGIMLQCWSIAGVTFRDFSLDTTGSSAVAWDCTWKPGPGPSTQCVIENILITVHDNFTDGTVAHVNWNDLNDTYPTGVTVRAGVTPSYTNCYLSMVQSGGLTAMNGCIWTGGWLLFGCQNGEMNHSWGTGTMFANGCLNHVSINAGYMYSNPSWHTLFRSQNMAANTGMKSLKLDSTELNTQADPSATSYFDINLFGALLIDNSEFLERSVPLFSATARGDGIGPAFCQIRGGTMIGLQPLVDCPNGSTIEVECEGFRDSATSLMVTKNRGGPFEPIIRGQTTIGTYTRGAGTYAKLIRRGNMVDGKLRVDWSAHTAPNTEPAIVTGFPLDRDTNGIEGAYIDTADINFAGARASFGGNQVSFYKPDNSPVLLAASGTVTLFFSYSVKA